MSVVLMNKRELNRLDVLARLNSNRLTVAAAPGLMNVTPRQTYRLLSRYRDGGAPPITTARLSPPASAPASANISGLVSTLTETFPPTPTASGECRSGSASERLFAALENRSPTLTAD
jgi:hypothetical protein